MLALAELRERQLQSDSPLWPLVRSLTWQQPLRLPADPLVELTVTGAFSDLSAAVDQLVGWPHVGTLEVLRLANWRAEAAGSVRRLLDALDGARLRGLHATDCGKACTTQVVEALAAGSWPALRAVSLSALNESLIEPLISSGALSQLEEVSLQRTRLEEDALSRLLRGLGSAHIAQLDLDHLTSPSLAQVIAEAFPSAQRLWVAFGEGGLEAFCEHAAGNGLLELVSHKQLDRRAGLSAGDCRALAAWPNSLRRLELMNHPIGDEGFAALAASPHLGQLQALRLSYCELQQPGLGAWARGGNSSLVELRLDDNFDLHADPIVALCESPSAASLEVLVAHGDALRDAHVERIARASQLTRLRHLELPGASLSKQGMQKLLASPAAQDLEVLNLNHPKDKRCVLKDAAVFVAATSLSKLRSLSLAGHKLTPHSFVEALAESARFEALEEIDLSDNRYGDEFTVEDLREARAQGLLRIQEVEAAQGP